MGGEPPRRDDDNRHCVRPDDVNLETDKEQSREMDEESEQARQPKVPRGPLEPTEQEKADHEATHLPYRSWCVHCLQGRGCSAPHTSTEKHVEAGVPVVSMDYAFLGAKNDKQLTSNEETEFCQDQRTQLLPTLVLVESRHKAIYAHMARKKGPEPDIIRFLVADLNQMGYKRVVIRTDGEPAIVALVERLATAWTGEILQEHSPAGESQSNGAAERAVRTLVGLVRTLLLALQARMGETIDPACPIMWWLVEHAATLFRRYSIGSDGRTSYERSKGRRCNRKVFEFGETVMWHLLTDSRHELHPMAPKFEKGVFLGIYDITSEIIIGFKDGVVRARDARRVPPHRL